MEKLGRGFVVWESNRTGHWRIWYRDLDGSGLRQLSPEEEGRDHFAPHIAPDGTHLVYLSYPTPRNAYKSIPEDVSVPLHLLRIEDGSNRVLVPSARSYKGDRAVVWLGNRELIYIDARGNTQQLDVGSGEERQLTEEPHPAFGFLINPTLTHATLGSPPTFSLYDPEKRSIALRRAEDGCQPYFSHDGRWGFWIEANGGPVRRIDLVTGATGNIIGRDDPQMPEGRGYLYFPMLSACQRLIAFAASRSPTEHDHVQGGLRRLRGPSGSSQPRADRRSGSLQLRSGHGPLSRRVPLGYGARAPPWRSTALHRAGAPRSEPSVPVLEIHGGGTSAMAPRRKASPRFTPSSGLAATRSRHPAVPPSSPET